MNKKIIPTLVLVSSFQFLAFPAFANNSVRPTIKAERQDLKGTPKQEREEAKITITQQRQDFRHKSLETVYNSVTSNLEKRFASINDVIKPRVEAKIADREKAGKNMAAAKAKLAEYSVTKYNADLAAFTAKYQELSATNPISVGSVPQLAKLANVVRSDLNSMRKVLLDAFRLAVKAK